MEKMVFKCQEDSCLKEFTSTVVSCEKIEKLSLIINGKHTDIEGYEVILEDTIIFPEGGGQPCDHGYLNDVPVKYVVRKEDKAVHYVDEPFNIGDSVRQTINWERRFDHMQQHSGQHLLSAVIEKEFQIQTISWWLGEEVSYVELDAPCISPEHITKAEGMINKLIRDRKNVTVKIYTKDTPEEELKEARSTRGLPADHKGDIRVISIEDVDTNMCCGTHVKNLSQLQVIKLLHVEKSKRKDKILLNFLVGNRVINRLETCLQREKKLTLLLNNNPAQHPELVEKLLKNVKTISKTLQTALKDQAIMEARHLKSLDPPPKYFFLHKRGVKQDYIHTFFKEVGNTDIFLFATTTDGDRFGNLVLQGDEKDLFHIGNKLCEILDGTGIQMKNKFCGGFKNRANLTKAEQYIIKYFQTVTEM